MTLTTGQFTLVHDIFSLTIAVMGAAALFFFFTRSEVLPQFRRALLLMGLGAAIGCYHYVRLLHSWNEAFEFAGSSYVVSGHLFHETYRSMNWLLTMPLLLLALFFVMAPLKSLSIVIKRRVLGATVAMIAFGYLGKVAFGLHFVPMQWLWWLLSMIPFTYLMLFFWRFLLPSHEGETSSSDKLITQTRNLIFISWSFYPLATFLLLLHIGLSATGLVIFNIGYSLADIAAIAGLGLYVTWLAKECSNQEG